MSIADDAAAYAGRGHPVIPLRGKIPLVAHGVLDATTDVELVGRWWRRWPRANIGVRPHIAAVVVDVDPRHDGDRTLHRLQHQEGELPATLTCRTGSGGLHLWFSMPPRAVVASLGDGLDIKTHAGYLVCPPSVHPDTGRRYVWANAEPVAPAPRWLRHRLTPRPRWIDYYAHQHAEPTNGNGHTLRLLDGDSPAERFNAARRWVDVLAGWTLVRGDGEGDGSLWRHPRATSPVSASVRHGCLFVYTPNAGLPVTAPGDPHGLTKFRVWAHLAYGGDLSAAARAVRR